MTRLASALPLGSEFDGFLFAPIGADTFGMPVSVLSALARMDIDPWQEAARLSGLPEEAAIGTLASLLAARPDGPSAEPGSARPTAARLIALLPRQTGPNAQLRQKFTSTAATVAPVAVTPAVLLLLLMALMLGAGVLAASQHPPAQIRHPSAPSSSTAMPASPSPSVRR